VLRLRDLWNSASRLTGQRWFRCLCWAFLALWSIEQLVFWWTQEQWFSSVGQQGVWRQRSMTQIALAGGVILFTLMCALVTLRNLLPLRDVAIPPTDSGFEPVIMPQSTLERWVSFYENSGARLSWALVCGLALWQARRLAMAWPQWMLWRNGSDFPQHEPFWNLNAAFYVFRLPFWHSLHAALWTIIFCIWLLCGVLWLGRNGQILLRRATSQRLKPPSRRPFMMLGALWFLLLALKYVLSSLDLVVARHVPDWQETALHPVLAGPSFVDWWVNRPLLGCGAILSLSTAIVWAWSGINPSRGTRRRSSQVLGFSPFLLLLSIISWGLPGALILLFRPLEQRFLVEPDEWRREAPFVAAHRQLTRTAWQLDEVKEQRLNVAPLSASPSLREVATRLPLWDEFSLQHALKTGQSTLNVAEPEQNVSFQRYQTATGPQLVAVQIREIAGSPTGVHVEAFSTTEAAPDGSPLPIMASQSTLAVGKTEIIYGPTSRLPVWNQHSSSGNQAGGIALNSFWQRALWAWRLRHLSLLWSSTAAKSVARLHVQRDVESRAHQLAPFLLPSGAPFPVFVAGRWMWMLDLMTTTAHFPGAATAGIENLASRTGRVYEAPNLARDAVKMVVDAKTGDTVFYASKEVAETDPILQAWRRAHAGLIRPFREMPLELRRLRRYPARLFEVQRQALQRYDNARTHLEDIALPNAATPSDHREPAPSSTLLLPKRETLNTTNWSWQMVMQGTLQDNPDQRGATLLQAPCDEANYGQLHVLRLQNRSEVLLNAPLWPPEASNWAATDAAPSVNNPASRMKWHAWRGKVLWVPLPSSTAQSVHLLLVQSLYRFESPLEGALASAQNATDVAQSRRWRRQSVAVADAARATRLAGVGFNLDDAAKRYFRGESAASAELKNGLQRAITLHETAQRAARAGDWARAGQLWKQEADWLKKLAEQSRSLAP
jgi:uncharacterized membrane protein (UPF0182 family)